MFCCRCGAPIFQQASICLSCGGDLSDPPSKATSVSAEGTPAPLKCHSCGKSDELVAWDFGLGKTITTKSNWDETLISGAISAVALPLIGVGIVRLPGNRSTFAVLRLRLLLCESCCRNRASYSCHPYWNEANRMGYTRFFDSSELGDMNFKR